MDSLGIRCLRFMENEMNNGVTCNPKLPATPRVKEYFSICTRNINGKEVPIGITQGNWCAAAISFSMHESLMPDEEMPHNYRVGCVEIQQDLQKSGKWFNADFMKRKLAPLMLGDILITDRSNPKDPSTAWWRHILRVSKVNPDDSFECISGNSTGGQFRISKHKLTDSNIVGFGLIDSREIKTLGVIHNDKFPTKEEDLNPDTSNFYDLYDDIMNNIK